MDYEWILVKTLNLLNMYYRWLVNKHGPRKLPKTEGCEDSPVKGYKKSFFSPYELKYLFVTIALKIHIFFSSFLNFSKTSKYLKKYPDICILAI